MNNTTECCVITVMKLRDGVIYASSGDTFQMGFARLVIAVAIAVSTKDNTVAPTTNLVETHLVFIPNVEASNL